MTFRLLGTLPLIFFLAHLRYHYSMGTPQHMLWMCNISNLVLAAGLLLNIPALVRVAAIWLIPGLPLWVMDMMRTTEDPLSTFMTHVGGLLVAIPALYKVRASKYAWLHAVLFAFLMQLVCRFFTPAHLNVNAAHGIYGEWNSILTHYWQFWLFAMAETVAGLWLLGFLLYRLFPPEQPAH